MTRSRWTAVAMTAAAALTVALPATASAKKKKVPTITISGATGSAPLVAQLAKKYVKTHPGQVKFKLAQGGGEVGVQDAAAGRVTIGNASRDPRPSDPSGLTFYPIAKDSICLAVNKSNGVSSLTLKQRQDIWTGAIRNWEQIPGSNLTGTIDVIGRTAASSQPPLVESLLLGGKKISSIAALKSSDGLVKQTIQSNPRAIGHLSGTYTYDGKVKSLAADGVACNLANAKSGQYPAVRTYYEVTRGKAT
ncbi:MAG TPA: substrate-binding domain-containing protein, partial [Baekduia sp.]|nr:substrate-binding domain-containing protein [Baekduia sp.]